MITHNNYASNVSNQLPTTLFALVAVQQRVRVTWQLIDQQLQKKLHLYSTQSSCIIIMINSLIYESG